MMRASCSRDALHELRPLEQVGEAVGLEDHGDDVGLVGLVELDEPRRRARRATRRAARAAGRGGCAPGAARPGCARARRAWRRGRPGSAAWRACSDGDVALQRVDPLRVGGDRRREDALAALLLLDLRASWPRSGSISGAPSERTGTTSQSASGIAATRIKRRRRDMRRAMLGPSEGAPEPRPLWSMQRTMQGAGFSERSCAWPAGLADGLAQRATGRTARIRPEPLWVPRSHPRDGWDSARRRLKGSLKRRIRLPE